MKKVSNKEQALALLEKLNKQYSKLHTDYEKVFWDFYMGDITKQDKLQSTQDKRDRFRSDVKKMEQITDLYANTSGQVQERLRLWKIFFEKYQTPEPVMSIKSQIGKLENEILAKRKKRKEGYIEPKTKRFVKASAHQMYFMTSTEDDEEVRKACYKATQEISLHAVDEYVQLVTLRNQYARELGYEDFYAYKLEFEEGMTKQELFALWDEIYEKTKYAFKDVRKMEKTMPGLRKPWNFAYMLSGDFAKESDPYFQMETQLERWGQSFSNCGFNFADGSLKLDLFERKGKYDNGFCHWPQLVSHNGKQFVPGEARFTCNAIYGQVGSGSSTGRTLFHEGGHAAHYLNSRIKDVAVNHEYPPSSTAWAETQSMFIDTMYGSLEWKMRYAKNELGQAYPFDLYERQLEKTYMLNPLDLMSIMSVCDFERRIYEEQKLTKNKVIAIVREVSQKYGDKTESSVRLLDVPHIYSFESSCAYQGYGLAELALAQWRKYFYTKYGYIVDNPQVGKEMRKVWSLAASKTFPELVTIATGNKLSAQPYIDSVAASKDAILRIAKKRVGDLEKLSPQRKRKINLKAHISMWHGKKKICDNTKSFEDMCNAYERWMKREFDSN